MGTEVPLRHPLRQLFGALTEKSFTEHLGWPDLNVTGYVSNLLVDFTHTDRLYKIRNHRDQPVDTVVDLLFESEVLLKAESMDRERDVHRHIGDFTLFMAGLFPEYLRRLKTATAVKKGSPQGRRRIQPKSPVPPRRRPATSRDATMVNAVTKLGKRIT